MLAAIGERTGLAGLGAFCVQIALWPVYWGKLEAVKRDITHLMKAEVDRVGTKKNQTHIIQWTLQFTIFFGSVSQKVSRYEKAHRTLSR